MSKVRTKVSDNELTIFDDKKGLSDSRFERHKAFGDLPKRSEINDKVKQGLLNWSFFALDNDKPYQYYIKIKK
jgi:hypothetical protein